MTPASSPGVVDVSVTTHGGTSTWTNVFEYAKATPSIAVTPSNLTPLPSEGLSFTAKISGGAWPGGNVSFRNGTEEIGKEAITGDTASLTVSPLPIGTHNITAVYEGDGDNQTATSAVSAVVVAKSVPVMTLTASENAVLPGANVTFEAEISGGASPGGEVTFHDGATQIGKATIESGIATMSTSLLAVGSHTIVASYTGDGDNAVATSNTVTVSVAKAAPTLILIGPATAIPTAPATFSAQFSGGQSPSGTVSFMNGATSIGTATIVSGVASLTTTQLALGSHTITAHYDCDSDNAAITSNTAAVTVSQAVPTVTLTASDNSPSVGTSVILTAELGGGYFPAGTVSFLNDNVEIGAVSLGNDTTVTFEIANIALGSYSFTAIYRGDTADESVTSAAEAVVVGQATPALVVTASPPNPGQGEVVTFTVTLSGSAAPSGIVAFRNGATTLATAGVDGGKASFSTSALNVGTHTIAAEYSGDANNTAASGSTTLTVRQTVEPADGSELAPAMAGEDYLQPIAVSGGNGALVYHLASGSLPDGVILNVSTGELIGPLLATAAVQDYAFTIGARDGAGATGTASYTLTVKERSVTVADKAVTVPAGTKPHNVDLAEDATGGPFDDAAITFVEPAHAGTASIVNGEFASMGPAGWYLKFTPNPSFSGTARVGFTLRSPLGSSSGVVAYTLGSDIARVAEDIDRLVHGFVRSRQSMISSTIKVPGLMERRRMASAADPFTGRLTPSETGMTASFSASLAQMEAARDRADGIADAEASPFNVWIDGTFMLHNRDENDNRWGSFGLVDFGADYLCRKRR